MSAVAPSSAGTGRLRLEFNLAPDGMTYVDRQYASYPYHVCRAHYLDDDLPGMATIYTQSCSGGLYTQECLDTSIKAGTGTQVHFTTQASTIVHKATRGCTHQIANFAIANDAFVEYLPDPVILLPGAQLQSTLRVQVEKSSAVILSDAFLAHDPENSGGCFKGFESEIILEDATGLPLVIDRYSVQGSDITTPVIGVTGGYTCHATLLAFMPEVNIDLLLSSLRRIESTSQSVQIGSSLLPGKTGVWTRVMVQDGAQLKDVMTKIWSELRCAYSGKPPANRRK